MAKDGRVDARDRRHLRIRKKVVGTAERPRMSVYRSLQHIYAQVIDDTAGRTLAAASTIDPSLRNALAGLPKADAAKRVGELLAERTLNAGIKRVVFDRGGNLYHGRVAKVAEGAREKGLEF